MREFSASCWFDLFFHCGIRFFLIISFSFVGILTFKMSLRQFLAGLQHQFTRFRQLYHVRPVLPIHPHGGRASALAQQTLRVPRPVPLAATWTIPTNINEFRKSVLRLGRMRKAAAYFRNWGARPGRVTVAPLLGFIAAFLQESKTDEFKTAAACVAAREDVNEYSKKNGDHLQARLDLSGFRTISDLEFGNYLGKGSNAAVYEARMKESRSTAPAKGYDLAVKILFNYSMHSSADEVSRLFASELVPSRFRHSNIIDVFRGLVDDMPRLPQSETSFPQALPQRLHPEGLGRNRTMFVLMNKYSCTLRDDIMERSRYDLREGLAIFAQLLEGLVKLGKENIVHRDLKSDNILLIKEGGRVTRAVLSDFGCSLNVMKLHYTSDQVCRGGNRALMAPEVVTPKPGYLTVIDYSRSDLWAIGAVAYEIFAGFNPFFEGIFRLNSATYDETRLPEVIPENMALNNLVHAILRRDPSKRPSPSLAATACHLLLWDFPLDKVPTLETVRLWIMCLCVKLICSSRENKMHRALLSTFLKRCQLSEIMEGWKLLTVYPIHH